MPLDPPVITTTAFFRLRFTPMLGSKTRAALFFAAAMTRFQRAVLRIAVCVAGALLMGLEISAFRIIGKSFGAALRETTAVISVFLAAMSVGYWAGGRAGDRWPRPSAIVTTLLGAALTCFCVPWIDAWVSPRIAASSFSPATHAFLAASALFVLPTILLAATSPIAVRLFATNTGSSGSNAGSISAISTAGSIAGSVATAFFLIDWLASINRTVIVVGLGAALTAAMIAIVSLQHRVVASLASAAVIVVIAVAFAGSRLIDRSLLTPLANTHLVYTGDSPYHHINVRDRGPWRELSFDIAIQSRMLRADPYGPGSAYADLTHVSKLLRPAAKRVLLIGLGGGTIPRQFIRYYNDTTIDAVDVDPLVAGVARRYFGLPSDPRLRIHIADGRQFLKRSNEKWDLIIIDAYTTNRYGDTIPAHLTTREFFREAASHLNPGGVLHFHCAFHRTALLPAIENTMRAEFPHVAQMRGEIIGSDTPLVVDRDAVLQRAQSLPSRIRATADSALRQLTEVAPSNGAIVLTDDYAPVDLLAHKR
jgi:spermidine synthase